MVRAGTGERVTMTHKTALWSIPCQYIGLEVLTVISAICSDPVVAHMIVHLCRNAVVMHRGTPTYFAMLSASLIITLIIINSRVGGEYILPVPGALCAL